MAGVTPKGRAIDGLTQMPGSELVPYVDWLALEREFLINTDYPHVFTWLREVKGWHKKRITSGNTTEKTVGWGKKRAIFQRELTQQAMKIAAENLANEVPAMLAAKLQIIRNIIHDVRSWSALNASDKQLCYQILKVELGESTNPNNLKPATGKDPVEALLQEYDLIDENGVIIDDDPSEDTKLVGGSDSSEATTPDSSASSEVPPA